MVRYDKVNILLVDDQPAKLLGYEVMLGELGENLIKAGSARQAFEHLLKNEIAVLLVDVCMPELDGFQLAAMIRDHPRFQQTAIIFISAIQLDEVDHLRGYQAGAVDYVPVPVIPEILRAKVRVFVDLFRKNTQLAELNAELERRVAERTSELEGSSARLFASEKRRNLALAAGKMGSWDWDVVRGDWLWDEGQYRVFGVDPGSFEVTQESVRALIHPEDWERLLRTLNGASREAHSHQAEFRVCQLDGQVRWCLGAATAIFDGADRLVRVSGVTVDITDRKEAEERQVLLAREVDHRARNTLAVVQSIVRLTNAKTVERYKTAVEGRIRSLAHTLTLLSQSRWQGADLKRLIAEEFAAFRSGEADRIVANGPEVSLKAATAQTLALVFHELATNAAKYGALSSFSGRVDLAWQKSRDTLALNWIETGGPRTRAPESRGFGIEVICASIEAQNGGRVEFDWRADGLRCSFSIPLHDEATTPNENDRRTQAAVILGAKAQRELGNRVLLVEDEALIAMTTQDLLTEFGFQTVGPCRSVAEALMAARDGDLDSAILDLNLRGEAVYPVADMLTARGVPFVFITGYDAESIDAKFSHVPTLTKPVGEQDLRTFLLNNSKGLRSRVIERSDSNEAPEARTDHRAEARTA